MSQLETSRATFPENPTRRRFLALALLASGAVLGARLARLSLRFAQPVLAPNEYGGVFNLGPLAGLPGLDDPPTHVPAGRFFVVQTASGLLALRQVCTHLDCLLGWDIHSQSFLCPCHGSQFAANGQVLNGPATRSLDRFMVQLATADGDIVAETDAASGAALPVPTDAPIDSMSDDSAASDKTAALVVWVDTGRRITVSSSP